jgi:eukaryotic-like serine/threonine-protein kinase
MDADLHVQSILEGMLDSGHTPEEACRDCPELLPLVLKEWRRKLACDAHLDALFATSWPRDLPPAPAAAELPQIPGHELHEVLGRGGMGVVYKARHLGLNRIVAVKMLLNGAHGSPEARERFLREAEAVAGLRHPNIVQVYDLGDQGGQPYFTMEFIDGGNLARKLEGTPQPPRHAATLLATLAEAVESAHLSGILHRDLKPSNVLLAADGTPKVSDFGLARRMEGEVGLTWTGIAVGTPGYMAPEQAEARPLAWGPAVDIYALGAIFYELLTGRPPFRAETAAETIRQAISQDPAPPSRLNAKVPRDADTICLKCLSKDPHLRYAGAAALASDLHRFLAGEAISARPVGRMARMAQRVRRRPVFSAGVAAVTLLTIILAAGGLWLISDRVAVAKKVEAERLALERAARQDLSEMARWLSQSSWPEARAAMERASGRLDGRGSAELRRLLNQGVRDLALVDRLDAIRLERAGNGTGADADREADESYSQAFLAAGFEDARASFQEQVSRIQASSVREAIVPALYEWAAISRDFGGRVWRTILARKADRDPMGWRGRAFDPAATRDKAAFAELAAQAPIAEQPVPFLLVFSRHLRDSGGDPLPFLVRIQRAHPGDFWANLDLGNALTQKGEPLDAARYYQAALAVRPGTAVVHNNLAMSLANAGRLEDAADHYLQALRADPGAASFHHNLALVLRDLGRHGEAIEHARLAVRSEATSAVFRLGLGVCLASDGGNAEAVKEFRQAVLLDPKLLVARQHLWSSLLNQRRFEEARVEWAECLDFDPPDHNYWYGYAELCIFLGREDDYRLARRALLTRFGGRTEPQLAERTARACLLLPATGDELTTTASLADRAASVDRSTNPGNYPYYMFVRGLADYRLGRLDRAIITMRGEASGVLGPAPRLVLAMAQYRDGHPDEARKTFAAAAASHDWSTSQIRNQDDWIYHTLRREAEAMIVPDLSQSSRP